MKKILIITGSDKNSGPNKQLINHIISLSKNKKVKITLLICKTVFESEKSILNDFNTIEDIIIKKMPMKNINIFIGLVLNLIYLKKLTKNNKYDLIQTSGFIPDSYIYFLKKFSIHKFIWITFVRSQIISEYKIRFKPLISGIIIANIHKLILNSSDILICVSNSVANQVVRKYKKFKVFHNTLSIKNEREIKLINKSQFQKNPKSQLKFYRFIYVGHFDYLKNPKEIIDFWIRKNFSKDRLSLFGRKSNSTYFKEIIKLSKSFKNITINDFKENIIKEYCSSDIYISASRTEGFPNTVIEALCSGCFCLLSDIPPHREIRDLFSDYIYLFELNSYESLDNAVKKVLKVIPDHPRWEVMQNAISYFSSKNLENSYLKVINIT